MVVSQKKTDSMKRIGIDARLYQELGIGRYIRNLLSELQKIDRENEYYIFLLKKDFEQVKVTPNFHKVLADFKWYGLAEQIKLPVLLKRYNLDLVHFPHFNIPILYQDKFIVTIHDLIHQNFKMRRSTTLNPLIYEVKHQVLKKVMDQAIKKSQKIITPSEFVKKQILEHWSVKDSKIVVTPEAVEDKILTVVKKMSKQKIETVLHKFKIKPPFLFYIGNAHPHKNVEGLIKAFLLLRQKYQYLQLVLAGNDHYFWQRLRKSSTDQDIIFTGYLTDEELVALYKSAQVYTFPSFSEGFGIPLLEAMACGCPVVSSNKTSLPEIGGDAAVYFDPHDLKDMTEKISKVLNEQKLRKSLIEKGQKRYKQFSWEKMAKQTLAIYQE